MTQFTENKNSASARFCNAIVEQFGKTQNEAQHILSVFLKENAARYDSGGQIQLAHGTYWAEDVMDNALEMKV